MSDLTNFINVIRGNRKIEEEEDKFIILKQGIDSIIKTNEGSIIKNIYMDIPIIDNKNTNKTNYIYFDDYESCIKIANRLNEHFKEEKLFGENIKVTCLEKFSYDSKNISNFPAIEFNLEDK